MSNTGKLFKTERANLFDQAALKQVFQFVFSSPDFTVSMEMAFSMSDVWPSHSARRKLLKQLLTLPFVRISNMFFACLCFGSCIALGNIS